jgi:cytochrome oxidase Cu insertion factor (SCO1/SenC/PrrC family)
MGDSLGRDIYFYSISVDPETDTPERLKAYAEAFGAGPGWLFLTGNAADIRALRHKLGDRGVALSEHRNEILLGNGRTGEWARNNVLADLDGVALAVRSMDASWRPPSDTLRSRANTLLPNIAGEVLYTRLCAGCHTVGMGDRVGPDLAGVFGRRTSDWLVRFIADPEKLRRQGDAIALDLAGRFPVVRMPGLGLNKSDVADLLSYIARLETDEATRRQPLEALFPLTTSNGQPLAREQLDGRPVAVFFGFTHCPDVCPTTLLDWSNVLADLGADGDRLKVAFVSVDTERDTPAALRAYLTSFDPRILALTGSSAAVARAARTFNAYYERVATNGNGFTFDHSTNVYLVDRDGRLMGTVSLDTPESERRRKLAELLAPR